jgi:hypothetical protein
MSFKCLSLDSVGTGQGSIFKGIESRTNIFKCGLVIFRVPNEACSLRGSESLRSWQSLS